MLPEAKLFTWLREARDWVRARLGSERDQDALDLGIDRKGEPIDNAK
jgi:hypothetical protein